MARLDFTVLVSAYHTTLRGYRAQHHQSWLDKTRRTALEEATWHFGSKRPLAEPIAAYRPVGLHGRT